MNAVAALVAAYFSSRHPPGVVAAYLFGSHGRAAPHRDSDVDVAVLLHPRRCPDRPSRDHLALTLASELIGAIHHNALDLVVLNDAPPELGSAIVTQGLRLYLADAEADHAFRRTAQLRHADLGPFLERTRRTKLAAILR